MLHVGLCRVLGGPGSWEVCVKEDITRVQVKVAERWVLLLDRVHSEKGLKDERSNLLVREDALVVLKQW